MDTTQWLLGGAYGLLGFWGAFVAETLWWRRRLGWRPLPVPLRTLLFLVLARGLMRLTLTTGALVAVLVGAVAVGFGILWLDRRYHHHLGAGGAPSGYAGGGTGCP